MHVDAALCGPCADAGGKRAGQRAGDRFQSADQESALQPKQRARHARDFVRWLRAEMLTRLRTDTPLAAKRTRSRYAIQPEDDP